MTVLHVEVGVRTGDGLVDESVIVEVTEADPAKAAFIAMQKAPTMIAPQLGLDEEQVLDLMMAQVGGLSRGLVEWVARRKKR